jgi:hypothetical protein
LNVLKNLKDPNRTLIGKYWLKETKVLAIQIIKFGMAKQSLKQDLPSTHPSINHPPKNSALWSTNNFWPKNV